MPKACLTYQKGAVGPFVDPPEDTMVLKDGVILAGLDIRMRWALLELDRLYKKYGRKEGVTITSGLDGEHSAGSMHYYGLAVDSRVFYFDDWTRKRLVEDLTVELCDSYDVILEKDHIHVEWRLIDGNFDVDGFFD